VLADPGVDERTEGEHLELFSAGRVKRRLGELGAEPAALEAVVDLGVREGDQPGPAVVAGEPGEFPVAADLEPALLGVVGDLGGDQWILRGRSRRLTS
jgi:hypothetical protein